MFASNTARGGFGNAAFRPGLGYGGYGFNRFGYGGFGYRGGFGCWGCGFGFGWGWGFGWGLGWGGWGLGFGWNPWWYSPWYDPFWYGDWGPGYGYYGAYPYYPPDNSVTYPPPYGPGDNNSNGSGDYQNQNFAAPTDIQPQVQSSEPAYENPNPDTGNVAESAPTVLLYMKDGTTLPATDYWVADGKLHYRISYGGEEAIDMSQLDLQRTVDENAKRGVRFTLKPQPVPSAPSSAPATAATSTT
jgi:hypothetical protein